MAITLHKADGFEHGLISAYVHDAGPTGTPTIVTTGQHSGLRGVQINPATTTEFVPYNSAFSQVCFAFYINFTTLPTVTGHVFGRIRNTNGNLILDWDNTNTKMRIKAGTGTAATGGPVITTGTWYRVVLEYDTSTTTFTGRCTIDGGTEFSSTVATTALACIDCSLGATSNSAYDAVYDDVIVSGTDGDYEQIITWTNWEVLSAIPTADGTHNIATAGDFDSFTTTQFDNTTTNGNTFIGHRPVQAANTAEQVIRQELGAVTDYMEFLFENPANTYTNVGGVQTHAGHTESASAGASVGEIQLMLSDNTAVLTTGAIDVINSTEDPGVSVVGRNRAAIAPSGGWDETKVDGLKARVGFSDNAPDVNFIDLMLEVLYYNEPTSGTPLSELFHTISSGVRY